ncbi:MAG: bifunctional phosphoribosyl-AMP cyclohydrolase/phosphoribosyl-ATP diphosphatase HisIE [Calditrichales bacterium]|nr:MAG: bifunctional phosphoribosyl-AMP cyclohydrolase/phosphoribosyl-ATP diphosphatase HisIE [Calditrichales bacterium]
MKIDFAKGDGLVPAVIQDNSTSKVLMLGYMNKAALEKTKKEGRVTFFSRSRNTLWTKGETSGNYLYIKEISVDCDNDTLLIKVDPAGPVCHLGQDTCFAEKNTDPIKFLSNLENLIIDRKKEMPENSYTTQLFTEGINKIGQKVGEEATETLIEAIAGNKDRLKEETADLLFHLLVLLVQQGVSLQSVIEILEERHKK